VIDAAVIVLRLLQYVGGSVLFGSALFLIYALRRRVSPGWGRPLLLGGAVTLALAALLGLVAQTIALAGSVELGLTAESLRAMLGTSLGRAALARSAAGGLATAALLVMPERTSRGAVAGVLGGLAVASFAWMGHGAASEGPGATVHLLADMIHALAAGLWIGGLVGFALLVRSADRSTLLGALHRFSAIGIPVVALVAASGLVNAWYMIGPHHLAGLFTTAYGRLLVLKLAAFGAMLAFAAANRWRHTEALARGVSKAAVRSSLTAEALLGIVVLALVAWFGMLDPPGLA